MIEINNISKYFGNVKAIENVSFNVSNGEIVGYVGLNGAGKTTTIRVAVGVPP
ncbi:MAG: ABC transporter ATP-binding protein, partial [Fervidicoccus fontis]